MNHELPAHEREVTQESKLDNARKFITLPLDKRFLDEHGAIAYKMITHWDESSDTDKKLVAKQYSDGTEKFREIEKVPDGQGGRKAYSRDITAADYYEKLAKLDANTVPSEKLRCEFLYQQGAVTFEVKYDQFVDSELCILEVDAANPELRAVFRAEDFPSELREVSGDKRYEGKNVRTMV